MLTAGTFYEPPQLTELLSVVDQALENLDLYERLGWELAATQRLREVRLEELHPRNGQDEEGRMMTRRSYIGTAEGLQAAIYKNQAALGHDETKRILNMIKKAVDVSWQQDTALELLANTTGSLRSAVSDYQSDIELAHSPSRRKRQLEREVEAGYELARAVNRVLARLNEEELVDVDEEKLVGEGWLEEDE